MAQNWEFGAAAGYGVYHDATISTGAGSAQAGMENDIAASAVVCEDRFDHFSGEMRYLYQSGHPFLSQSGTKAEMNGESHAFVYDGLFHFRKRESSWRPYVALGIGIKGYIGGPTPAAQPLSKEAGLTATDQWLVVGSAGAGIKFKLQRHVVLRFDVRDYISPVPKKQIHPAPGASVSAVLQQITPMAGISYMF